MKILFNTTICLAAASLFTSFATAQCALAPTDVLNATNWAFHWESPDYPTGGTAFIPIIGGSASIGTFSVARAANGLNLNGTMTVNANDSVYRLASMTGKADYQCDPNSSVLRGGTLQFGDGRQGTLWQFVFANSSYAEMYMVNEIYTDNIFLSKVLKGNAVRIDGPATCPGNPLSLLDTSAPLGWSLQTQTATYGYSQLANLLVASSSSAIGILNFKLNGDLRNGGPSLTGNITANHSFKGANFNVPENVVIRLADTAGRYQVYPGCTGGTMSMMVGLLQVQYEFVFASGDYSRLFLLSTSATGTGQRAFGFKTDILNGVMKRF